MSRPITHAKRGGALLAAAALTASLAACGSTSSASGGGDKPHISFIAAQMTSTYFQVMECGAKDAAKKSGVDLDWQGDANWDLQTQTPLINAAMQSKPDGMVIVPTDPEALIQTVKDIAAKNVPVLTVDGSLNEPVELQNIRTDNLGAGALAADALAKAIGDKGTVMVIASQPGIAANAERVKGFADRMAKAHTGVKVLPTQYAKDDQAAAANITNAALTDPTLKGIYTTLAPASAGASSAIQAAGKTGKVKLVAYDADPSQVQDLKKGVYDALVAQDPYGLGYNSVERVAKVIDGSLDPKSLKHQEYVSAFIITRDNVDSPEAQRHIYKPTC